MIKINEKIKSATGKYLFTTKEGTERKIED